jgi:hypothetical protein
MILNQICKNYIVWVYVKKGKKLRFKNEEKSVFSNRREKNAFLKKRSVTHTSKCSLFDVVVQIIIG